MQWKTSRITLRRWQAGDYIVTETGEPGDRAVRLDVPDAPPEYFATPDDARRVAHLRNQLALVQADNARLRTELDTARGIFPTVATPLRTELSQPAARGSASDGRGIPTVPHTAPALRAVGAESDIAF